jgi:hypothetical protein
MRWLPWSSCVGSLTDGLGPFVPGGTTGTGVHGGESGLPVFATALHSQSLNGATAGVL